MCRQIRITKENVAQRIDEAMHTILACWGEWDGAAQQLAQVNQTDEAWFAEMKSQIGAVLIGMVFDQEAEAAALSHDINEQIASAELRADAEELQRMRDEGLSAYDQDSGVDRHVVWVHDNGDSSVGIGPSSGWEIVSEDTSTAQV
ncbi:hypothetical protein [Schlesneria sp.]|uniref:hypothetical protein n=1 Tax=Schlesneria sp. TaxID=2762018 RepID=UPI002EFFADF3